jgi:pheromone shutdown protein TraB
MTWYRLVGTSHIAPTAKQIIATATQEFKPDVIAVELDPQRLAALAQGVKPDYHPRLIGQLGVRGYLFALIGSLAQRHLGKIVNVTPGSDMLAAVTVAQQEKLRPLVDRPRYSHYLAASQQGFGLERSKADT